VFAASAGCVKAMYCADTAARAVDASKSFKPVIFFGIRIRASCLINTARNCDLRRGPQATSLLKFCKNSSQAGEQNSIALLKTEITRNRDATLTRILGNSGLV
jgi:hypothetical protein